MLARPLTKLYFYCMWAMDSRGGLVFGNSFFVSLLLFCLLFVLINSVEKMIMRFEQ